MTSEQLSHLPTPLASQFGVLLFAPYHLALMTTVLFVVRCVLVLESWWEHVCLKLRHRNLLSFAISVATSDLLALLATQPLAGPRPLCLVRLALQ